MSQMETESPDITNSCERSRISPEIEGLDIIINLCTELVNLPGTEDNQETKANIRASIDDAQGKKDALGLWIPSYTTAPNQHEGYWQRPCDFEPRSSDEGETNCHPTATGEVSAPLHSWSSVALQLEPATLSPRVRGYDHYKNI
ncbi:hypothetical protein TNCV_3098421 [Trichonephila clavipes]|nr:hypothetical protein TNCV_3098421 [Trichonephila clavipes]